MTVEIFTMFAFLLTLNTVCSLSLNALRIGAFNIQVFGKSKMNKPEVVDVLVDVISRYDILLIQEIRDSSGEAIEELLTRVNEKNPGKTFSMEISPRLGRTTSKEEYAFLYRKTSGVSVVDVYVYEDGDESLNTANVTVDTFEREPYIIKFKSVNTVIEEFAIIGIHVAPNEAVAEINHLESVFTDVKQRWGLADVLLMGDLNAGCSYVPQKAWPTISLKSNPDYKWLISDDVDTTVSYSDCPYDRFIMTGQAFLQGYVNGSASVYRFDHRLGLNQSFALDVSDHFPIELLIKDKIVSSAISLCCKGPGILTGLFLLIFILY